MNFEQSIPFTKKLGEELEEALVSPEVNLIARLMSMKLVNECQGLPAMHIAVTLILVDALVNSSKDELYRNWIITKIIEAATVKGDTNGGN